MAWRTADYWLVSYRRTWRGTVVTSFLNPVLYLVAMGVLLGGFVAGDPARLDGADSYLEFVAPGLLVSQAMQVALFETTYPVHAMVKWDKTYLAMQASPLRLSDMVAAHLGAVLVRLTFISLVFVGALAAFGTVSSPLGALLALAAAVLTGAAFAFPCFAFVAGVSTENSVNVIFRLVMVPLFLFSGAFFPLSNLPQPLEWLAWATPLWHGVDLARMFTVGNFDATGDGLVALLHIAVLLAFVAVGAVLAPRRLASRLGT